MCGIVKLHPARGRKHGTTENVVLTHNIAIDPRKGTETLAAGRPRNRPNIAIYPRKGTETRRPKCKSRRMPIAIYPRKGTETR